MRWSVLLVWTGALFAATGWLHAGQAEPPRKGLAVHEWGVFRTYNDHELANADMKAIWEGLPRFVYGQVKGRDLPLHWPNLEIIDRPILFFHAPEPVDVELRIDFPGGYPAVWWPGTQTPSLQGTRRRGRRMPPRPTEPSRYLEWRFNLKEPFAGARKDLQPEPVAIKHWVNALRKVKADDVFARVGEANFGCERERFIYYDGFLPRGKWVTLAFDKDKVTLTNQARHPVLDVTLVDRRDPERVRVARLARLDAGAHGKPLAFTEEARGRWPGSGAAALLKQLQAAGLYEDEAGSLIELTRAELFEAGGLTLFYRLPQDEYERLLPLRMKPRPEKLVRVGLVLHPHCEPDLPRRVLDLIEQLGDDEFAVREQAQKKLLSMGRAAFVHMARVRRETDDNEVKVRLDRLLDLIESERGLGGK